MWAATIRELRQSTKLIVIARIGGVLAWAEALATLIGHKITALQTMQAEKLRMANSKNPKMRRRIRAGRVPSRRTRRGRNGKVLSNWARPPAILRARP